VSSWAKGTLELGMVEDEGARGNDSQVMKDFR
jgi:hypothetical protein